MKKIIFAALLFSIFLLPLPRHVAMAATACPADLEKTVGSFFTAKYCGLTDLITSGLNIMFVLLGLISAVFIIWGGFQYIVSSGNEEKSKAARATLTNAVLGLAIAILAYSIVSIISNTIANTTPATNNNTTTSPPVTPPANQPPAGTGTPPGPPGPPTSTPPPGTPPGTISACPSGGGDISFLFKAASGGSANPVTFGDALTMTSFYTGALGNCNPLIQVSIVQQCGSFAAMPPQIISNNGGSINVPISGDFFQENSSNSCETSSQTHANTFGVTVNYYPPDNQSPPFASKEIDLTVLYPNGSSTNINGSGFGGGTGGSGGAQIPGN
jgi:hypothetical protein